MSLTQQNQNTRDDPFTLTVDQYGRLWLHTKLEGVRVAIDLADKDTAFAIIAETMTAEGFEHRPTQTHDGADNDDQPGRCGP
jgi:hypothetical protein